MDKFRTILNTLFIIMAVVTVVVYFTSDFSTFLVVGLTAIGIKLMEFFIRYMF